ncbi:MAG: VWA domain-containing protein, partial [Pseudomonadota bacterium]|nr:VWA domain-containing protein [Pseudomonadota bacterium]
MKRKQRNIEGISLSFLDVISCGFGALILLLVLTKVYEPVTSEQTVEDLARYLLELQQTLEQIQGET